MGTSWGRHGGDRGRQQRRSRSAGAWSPGVLTPPPHRGLWHAARAQGLPRNLGDLVTDRRVNARLVRAGKVGGPKPAMHGHEKSDRCIVPMKSANKAEQSAAERMEGRRLVEGRPAGKTRTGHRTGRAWHMYRPGPAASLHRSPRPRTAQRYYPRQEPGAGKPHAGICAGGWPRGQSLPRPLPGLLAMTGGRLQSG